MKKEILGIPVSLNDNMPKDMWAMYDSKDVVIIWPRRGGKSFLVKECARHAAALGQTVHLLAPDGVFVLNESGEWEAENGKEEDS